MLDDLEHEIRKYKLDELLFLLAELSRELFLQNNFLKTVTCHRRFGGFSHKFNQLIPAWALADLSYIAIRNSNDYRSQRPCIEDVYKLLNLLAKASNELAAKKKVEIAKEDMKMHILLGLSQKQFWYQEITRGENLYYNFLRYFILLTEVPHKHFRHNKQPSDDLFELTGFDIKDFAQLMMAGHSWLHQTSSISFKIENEVKNMYPILTENNLVFCISHFTGDYNYYRDTSFPNNPLFFKPIIKTSTNKFIISNAFIWARKFYEGIFWLIRDKYMNLRSQTFINNFGEYYEKYIEEVLKFYLKPDQYSRVRTGGNKSADWLIQTDQYILVIEQKSCLMKISLKEEYPSIVHLDKYLNNFREAYLQIDETVKRLGKTDKPIIKLVLHFEKFYLGESLFKERVSDLCKNEIMDLSNYFFIDTEEFERLIQVLSEDKVAFNKIIETKVEYEKGLPVPILEGKEFNHVIAKFSKTSKIRFLEDHAHLFNKLFDNGS